MSDAQSSAISISKYLNGLLKRVFGFCSTAFWLVPCVVPAFGQSALVFEFSAHGGVPLNHTLQSAFCCTTGTAFVHYEPSDASYLVGVSGGVVIRDRMHISFGATYMPVSYVRQTTTCCPLSFPQVTYKGSAWEFPVLVDYRWLHGTWRPFSGGGMVLFNSTSGGANQSPSPAVTAGVEWLRGNFVIRPEFRYIHYFESFGSGVAVGRPVNQSQFLIGGLYRISSR